jgi:hypothetical protein
MKIVVKGRDFEELTEAALPYVEKHPHLAERRRWWVDDAPEGGLMAIADSDPPRLLTPDDLPPRAAPRRKRIKKAPEPLLVAEAEEPPRVVPDPVLIEREVERQLGPMRAEIERLRRDVERASGRVSIDDFDTFASPAGDPPFHGDLVS